MPSPIRLAALAFLTLAVCAESPMPGTTAPDDFTAFAVSLADDQLCAGSPTVLTEITGSLKAATVQSRLNHGSRVIEAMSNGRITLRANGVTLSSTISGQTHYDRDANGDLEGTIFLGSKGDFTVPGHGRVTSEVGPIRIAPDGTVTRERGQHDGLGASPDTAALVRLAGSVGAGRGDTRECSPIRCGRRPGPTTARCCLGRC